MLTNLEEVYKKVWENLQYLGYKEGGDITYYDYITSCEDVGVDDNILDIDYFCEQYKINIG